MNSTKEDRRHSGLGAGMAAVECNTAETADTAHCISTVTYLVSRFGLMLTADDTAEVIGCSASHVRAMCASGEIPAIKVGQRWRIPATKLASLLDGEAM